MLIQNMTKISRIIKLLHILNSRAFVTMKTITKECQIPERTAYRYLNSLSESNIPLYFDKSVKAYRINRDTSTLLDLLTTEERIYIFMSLKVLSKMLNKNYQSDIKSLYGKVQSYKTFFPQELSDQLSEKLDKLDINIDLINELNMLFLQIGILTNNAIEVEQEDTKTKQHFESPALHFDKFWRLIDKEKAGNEIEIDKINKVNLTF